MLALGPPVGAKAQDVTRRPTGADRPAIFRPEDESADWAASGGAEASVGYDTNPAAGADPEQFQVPTGIPGREPPMDPGIPGPPGMGMPEEPGREPSAYSQMGVRLMGEVGRRWWLRGRLGADFRQYFDGNRRAQEWLGVDGGWRSNRWLTRLTLEASRYDDTLIPDDAWTVRSDVGVSRWIGDHGMLGVHVEAGSRHYDLQDTRDAFVGGGVFGGIQTHRARLGVGLDVQRRWSTFEVVNRTELVPWVAAGYRWDALDLDVRYTSHGRLFDEPSLDGHEHRVSVRSLIQPWRPPVAIVLAAAFGRARGDEQAFTYDRLDVSAGLMVRFDRQAQAPLPSEAVAETQGPATVSGDGVRFRIHRPGAGQVAVMGSFNGWDPERGRLERRGDGWFEGFFPLPSGRHQYQLVVDGEAVTPEGAPGYLPDGFGGRNATLVVP
jgi:hypothetical protein